MKFQSFSVLLLLVGNVALAMEKKEQPTGLEDVLGTVGIEEHIGKHLTLPELERLRNVSKRLREALEPYYEERTEQDAKLLSHVLNAQALSFYMVGLTRNSANKEAFLNNALKLIDNFAKKNPGRWIKLNLSGNAVHIGNDQAFFAHMMKAIIDKIHALNIDITELDLSHNGLRALPVGIFAGLTNLQKLNLNGNQLTALPEGIFAGLTNLQELDLFNNQLAALPAGIFAALTKLQFLFLGNNPVAKQALDRAKLGLNGLVELVGVDQ